MARPRKDPSDRIETQVDPQMPIPVTVVKEAAPNPWADKYPGINDPVEKRLYKFIYNQNPGTPLEFSKGRSVLKANGLPGVIHEDYCLEDDNEYELPVDVAKHLNTLLYFEEGKQRPRCSCIEV